MAGLAQRNIPMCNITESKTVQKEEDDNQQRKKVDIESIIANQKHK